MLEENGVYEKLTAKSKSMNLEAENYLTADINSDGQINVQDIILIVNIIINS